MRFFARFAVFAVAVLVCGALAACAANNAEVAVSVAPPSTAAPAYPSAETAPSPYEATADYEKPEPSDNADVSADYESAPANIITARDFADALSEGDIAAAKAEAERFYAQMPNQEEMLGVISIELNTDGGKDFLWADYGGGLGGNEDNPKYAPGDLAVFIVETRRYGSVDSITLCRDGSGWAVLSYGR